METKLARIEDKIDKIVDRISSIDVTLARQHVSLEEHIRRTVALEQIVGPVQKDRLMAKGALKVVGALIAGAAIIAEILNYFRK